jgi:uridylate kinase
VDLIDLTRGDVLAAGTLAPLRSGDAVALAVALRCTVDTMITCDSELTERAQDAGLTVQAPR